MLKILLVGGAGFIGSHTYQYVKEKNEYDIYILDNLSEGNRNLINIDEDHFFNIDITDYKELYKVFIEYKFDYILHFAALTAVEDSVKNPDKYYKINVGGTINILDCAIKSKVKGIIFSSTAAVYGNPDVLPINEETRLSPINPYGSSKLICEQQIISAYEKYNLNYVILRYFNVSGANPNCSNGERHRTETHLIPIIIKNIINNTKIKIFGNDYETSDGTCVRDYVHVMDVAAANYLSLKYLIKQKNNLQLNIGGGNGTSVSDIISYCEEFLNKKADISFEPRRDGDAPSLTCDSKRAFDILNWQSKYGDIKNIIEHSINWILKK